jgi:predicted dehydrogenase
MNAAASIRVAVVGAGATAREHLRAFRDVPGVELAGICSRSRSKAEAIAAEFGLPAVCQSLGDLAAQARPDLVVIAVTIPATRAVCMEALGHDWALLIEKPLGVDLAEAIDIAAHARSHKRRAYVAFNRRFYASSRWVKAGLDAIPGRRFIRIQDQEDVVAAAADGHAKAVLDNWMFANSIHLIDMMRYFARSPVRDVRIARPWTNVRDFQDVIVAVDYENGDSGLYEGIWNAQGPWAVTVTTPDRRFEMRPVESAFYQNRNDRTPMPMTADPLDSRYKPGFYLQAVEAVKAARGEAAALADLDDALATMRLTHRLFGLGDGAL